MPDTSAAVVLRATLTYDERCKSRLLLRLDNGEVAALMIERGRVLRDAEQVRLADGRHVQIVAAPESLVEAVCEDPVVIAKAAYHLGNRHVAVQVMRDRLRFAADHVLKDMVAALGLDVRAVVVPFEPESGAYGHHHARGGEAPSPKPKIHTFTS